MPSFDLRKIVRTPTFRAKLGSMMGLSAAEKAMFQRVGNLIDSLQHDQRQVGVPGASDVRVITNAVPGPENIVATAVIGGFELTWDPVDIPRLEFYEVEYGETATFATSAKIKVVGTRVVVKANVVGGVLFMRLRAVNKDGGCSLWSNTSTVSTAENFFNSDQDDIDPENRSTVLPKPELIGGALTNSDSNDTIFTGVGATIGPSPFNLDDTGQVGFATNINIRHDVTYDLHENAFPYPGLEIQRVETIADRYLDADLDGDEVLDSFYTFSPEFYIYPAPLSGSFTDFFGAQTVTTTPAYADVELLRYQDAIDFYVTHYRQAGFIYNAVMSTIKF